MSDPGYLWYNLFGLFYTQGFPMTPAFPDPFFPLAPCLCVRTRYRKRPPGVRDAFSEAFGAKNRLLRYGRDIRYRKRPPTVRGASSFGGTRYRKRPPGVRNMRAVQKTGFCGTRRVFRGIRCKKQASTVRKRYSVPETPSYGTGYIFIRRHSVPETPSSGTGCIFRAQAV